MKHRTNNGFTLIEILLYIALVSGLLIAASTFSWNIINSKTKSQSIQEVEMNGKLIMGHLTRVIRSARSVDVSSLLNSNLADPGNAGQSVSLDIRDATDDPTIVDVNNGTLRLQIGTGPAVAISSNLVTITNLTLHDYGLASGKSENLGITLTLERINPESRNEYDASITLTTAVEIRDRS